MGTAIARLLLILLTACPLSFTSRRLQQGPHLCMSVYSVQEKKTKDKIKHT